MEHQELIGKRFGRLTLKATEPHGQGFTGVFRCDCGSELRTSLSMVVKHRCIRSCGCARRDWSKTISDQMTKDIAGQRFGKLVVLDRLPPHKKDAVKWRCICDCGSETLVRGTSLRSGHTSSCGCAKNDALVSSYGRAVNLSGRVFGRLTAVEKTEKRKNGKVVWACSCSCGTMIEVRSTQLTHGETKSCGCLKLEMAHNNGIGGAGSLS